MESPRLTHTAQDLLEHSVAWMDRYWDAGRGLLWGIGEVADPRGEHLDYHIVRETAWYALGLLMRGRTDDANRAAQALETVLRCQFDEPGRVYHGTFYRAPEEPHPPEGAIEWRHYDPNWREFIITTFAVILGAYEDCLPRQLIGKIDVAVRKAVEGALARPLTARYSNIALMNSYMLVWAGDRLGEHTWVEAGEAMGREVHRLFNLHNAFEEYNSPTYYGTDLYALGLWQAYCASPVLRDAGTQMEAALWRDIAQFYHAGLGNLAGPYDRAYGMDMRRYVALLGEWIWLVTGPENAPFPDASVGFTHAADFCFAPLVAILGPRMPPEVIPHLRALQGERCIERALSDMPHRTATAWLSEKVMIGAEHTSLSDIGQTQFHPATIHWRVPPGVAGQAGAGRVGWVRLIHTGPVDAVASPRRLVVTGLGTLFFLVDAPQVNRAPPGLQEWLASADCWRLPGLAVQVKATTPGAVERAGEQVSVRYAGEAGQEIRIALNIEDE